jgi:hypothetical protein
MRIVGNDPTLSRQITATASGAISAAGKPLIVNTDGTVLQPSSSSFSSAVGSEVEFESGATDMIGMTFDSNAGKVVIFYEDEGNSNYGTAVVGTVDSSDNSISFGTPVVFNSGATRNVAETFDSSNNKVVVAYRDQGNSSQGTAIVGTVSGTSISFGSEAVFNTGSTSKLGCTFDSSNNKVVISYQDGGNSSYGTAVVGTVSGTSISFGSEAVFESASTDVTRATFDSSNNKVVIAYIDGGNSDYGTAIVGTVSETSISFGSAVVFESGAINSDQGLDCTFDSANNKVIIAFVDNGDSDKGKAIVGTVSGTSISFGTAVVFNNAATTEVRTTFDSNVGKAVVFYNDSGDTNRRHTFISGTVSGTSISFGSEVEARTESDGSDLALTFDSTNNKVVCAFRKSGGTTVGKSIVHQVDGTSENLTTENFIGTSAHAAADGAKVLVNTQGAIDENQSGLTAGQTFFVNKNGALVETTNITTSAGTSVVFESAAFGSNEGSISFDTTNNRIIIAYPDDGNSSYGTAIVGTVDASNNSITFGTPEVFVSVGTSQMTSAFDTNAGKVAIMYRQGSTSRAIVGTVDSSDNSMSFGSSMEWNSTYSNYQYATFDSTNNKILMVFSDYTSGTNGMAIVGTISGTDITFSSKATFYSGTLFNQTIQFDPSQNKSLITYRKSSDNKPYVRVGDSSSGSFSFGTEVNINTTVTGGFCSVYHADEQKMVIFYGAVSGSVINLDAKVATISGTDVTLGNAVSIDTGNVGDSRAIYDPDGQQIAVVYRVDTGTAFELKLLTLSGDTLALSGYTDSGDGTVLDSDDAYYFDVVYDTNADRLVTSYYDNGNSGYGTAVVARLANDSSGSLSHDAVTAGTALSATKLLVKG